MKYGWSLDESVWDGLEAAAAGTPLAWKRRGFDPTYQDFIPGEPGVYAICSQVPVGVPRTNLPDRLYETLYVGKAKNLRKRFVEHCTGNNSRVKSIVHFFGPQLDFWFATTPLEEIGDIESRIIGCLGPSANKISGSVIDAVIREPVSLASKEQT